MSAGTWISPKASLSVLVLAAILVDVACRFLLSCREYVYVDFVGLLVILELLKKGLDTDTDTVLDVEDVELKAEADALHVENNRGAAPREPSPSRFGAW